MSILPSQASAQARFDFEGDQPKQSQCGASPLPGLDIPVRFSGIKKRSYSLVATHSFGELKNRLKGFSYEPTGKIRKSQIESRFTVDERRLEKDDHVLSQVWPGAYKVGLFDTHEDREIKLTNLVHDEELLVLPPEPRLSGPDQVQSDTSFTVEITDAVAPDIEGKTSSGLMYLIAINLDEWVEGEEVQLRGGYDGRAEVGEINIRSCIDAMAEFEGLEEGYYELQLRQRDSQREDPLIARKSLTVCDDPCSIASMRAPPTWALQQWPQTWYEELAGKAGESSLTTRLDAANEANEPQIVWGIPVAQTSDTLPDFETSNTSQIGRFFMPKTISDWQFVDQYLANCAACRDFQAFQITPEVVMHWGRNQLNGTRSFANEDEFLAAARSEGWIDKLSIAPDDEELFHENRTQEVRKYISTDGHEWVFNQYTREAVTHASDKGTYNYGPQPKSLEHVNKDILPWLVWGSGPDDDTTLDERKALLPPFYRQAAEAYLILRKNN